LSGTGRQAVPLTDAERADQIIARCRELALCTEVGGETTRTFLAPSMHSVHALLTSWMRPAGMTVRIDAAGNLRGVLPASVPDAPRLLIGSHLDTIANAGAFDGVLGVVMGVTLVETMVELARADDTKVQGLPFEIEVIGFSEEEGVRFGKPFLGSLALMGQLDSEILARTDRVGVSVGYAIRQFGLDIAELPAARIADSAFGYIEFHIEQGPVLENESCGLGVVDAIAGQTRMEFIFTGQANHAGTTPMGRLRRDALATAAYWIAEVERYADACEGLVATVGKVESSSSAGNVIAGRFLATLDVRHPQDAVRRAAVRHYIEYAEAAGASRGVAVAYTTSIDQTAVPMCSDLSAVLGDAAARSTGREPLSITSGAGHDAMIVARRVPSAILFLRSPGGLSHHPDEAVRAEDVQAAFVTGVEFLRSLRDDRAMLERLARRAPQRWEDAHA
jgi:allantoate deiminase